MPQGMTAGFAGNGAGSGAHGGGGSGSQVLGHVRGPWRSCCRLYGVRSRKTLRITASAYSHAPVRRGGVDLPIDHFRLLGVSPASDAQTVLRTLDQRLDRVPDQGFTTETLQARARLLRESADLLSDAERRHGYEAELTSLAGGPHAVPALDVPSSLEVAGLLLLLEAGQPLEAFELACRALQPPQAPALGSTREADLSLLAGLACRAAADESRGRRHFEAASRQLQQGLQLLQRMGQLPDLRQRLVSDLDALTPFLVLDLLSRELTAVDKRQEGLELLEQLVQRRGGLEGDLDPGFSSAEFQAFFKQIRSFLTVQEQVDLFSRWAEAGSEAADFLSSITLTASGFAQRKPERIAAARERLQASGRTGIEPLLANLHLLLGEVDVALATFAEGAGPELRDWADRQSREPLAQLCAYCRDWLANDVLPGYRDLEADPDLDAYFADRDVIAWVEREDRRSGRHYAPPALEPLKPFALEPAAGAGVSGFSSRGASGFDWSAPLSASPSFSSSTGSGGSIGTSGDPFAPTSFPEFGPYREDEDELDEDHEVPVRWRLPDLAWLWGRSRQPDEVLEGAPAEGLGQRLRALRPTSWRPTTWPLPLRVAGAVGLGLAAGLAAVLLRPRAPQPQPPARPVVTLPVQPAPATSVRPGAAGVNVPAARPASGAGAAPAASAVPPTPAAPSSTLAPLTAAEPSDAELKGLLQSWLKAKADVLAGEPLPPELEQIARSGPIARLREERRDDVAAGQRQTIDVAVEDLSVVERSDGRLAVRARLRYSDERRDGSGRVVETTPPMTLRNVYVFGRDGGRWRLAATRSGG